MEHSKWKKRDKWREGQRNVLMIYLFILLQLWLFDKRREETHWLPMFYFFGKVAFLLYHAARYDGEISHVVIHIFLVRWWNRKLVSKRLNLGTLGDDVCVCVFVAPKPLQWPPSPPNKPSDDHQFADDHQSVDDNSQSSFRLDTCLGAGSQSWWLTAGVNF